MTIILAAQTDYNRWLIALSLPSYKPSLLLGVIAALFLALLGLSIDVLLFPVGTLALPMAIVASGIVWGVLALELRKL